MAVNPNGRKARKTYRFFKGVKTPVDGTPIGDVSRPSPEASRCTQQPVQVDRSRPAAQARRFEIRLGKLGEGEGLTLAMNAPDEFVISSEHASWTFRATVKGNRKRTSYVETAAAKVRTCEALTPDMLARLNLSKSKSVDIHRLIAVIDLGADFRLNGGNLGTHHCDLNGGNNAAGNLMVLSQRVHDAVHRAIDADPEGYLASLGHDPTGMAFLRSAPGQGGPA